MPQASWSQYFTFLRDLNETHKLSLCLLCRKAGKAEDDCVVKGGRTGSELLKRHIRREHKEVHATEITLVE